MLIGRACTELSAECSELSGTFSSAKSKKADFLNAIAKAHTKSVHIRKCLEYVESRNSREQDGLEELYLGATLGPGKIYIDRLDDDVLFLTGLELLFLFSRK